MLGHLPLLAVLVAGFVLIAPAARGSARAACCRPGRGRPGVVLGAWTMAGPALLTLYSALGTLADRDIGPSTWSRFGVHGRR